MKFVTYISFSSYEQPIRIPNFYNEFFVYLSFEYTLPGKSFELRLKDKKNANITVDIQNF